MKWSVDPVSFTSKIGETCLKKKEKKNHHIRQIIFFIPYSTSGAKNNKP